MYEPYEYVVDLIESDRRCVCLSRFIFICVLCSLNFSGVFLLILFDRDLMDVFLLSRANGQLVLLNDISSMNVWDGFYIYGILRVHS